MTDIVDKLNQYRELLAQRDVIRLQFDEMRKSIIPAEVQQALNDLDLEQGPILESIDTAAKELEEEIKAEVAAIGASVRGEGIQAVFNRGRVTWDTKALEVYSKLHPELAPYRKEGQPYTTIKFS